MIIFISRGKNIKPFLRGHLSIKSKKIYASPLSLYLNQPKLEHLRKICDKVVIIVYFLLTFKHCILLFLLSLQFNNCLNFLSCFLTKDFRSNNYFTKLYFSFFSFLCSYANHFTSTLFFLVLKSWQSRFAGWKSFF